jgi:hypothetical protein
LFFTGAPLLPTIFFARRSPILTIHHQLGTIDCPHRPPPYTSFSAAHHSDCPLRFCAPLKNTAPERVWKSLRLHLSFFSVLHHKMDTHP